MNKITYTALLVAALTAGCQSLPPAPSSAPSLAAVSSVTPGAADTDAQAMAPAAPDREALIHKLLASYSTLPTDPFLRIEPGAHIHAIHALAVSPRDNLLATASVDLTVRVWDKTSGELKETLRPPMGSAGQGTMHALAFSPDGTRLAAGGLSFFAHRPASPKQAQFTAYLFDPVSGEIAASIDDLPGRVHHLAYSANGRQLAVAYGATALAELGNERIVGSSGVRIYDAQSFAVLKEVSTDSPCDWVEFDAALRLFASCRNTLLSLDERGPLRLREAPRDAQFHRAALAPDGRSLALSYAGRARLEVLSSDDLALLHVVESGETLGATHGDLLPAWSPGGTVLYAGARRLTATTKNNEIFRWQQGGRGALQRLPVGRMDVLAMQALRDGRLLFAASNGSVDVLDVHDKLSVLIADSTVSSDNRPEALWVSADGSSVAYSDDDDGRIRHVFSHARRTLVGWDDFKARAALQPPRIEGPMQVADWQLSRRISCNGAVIDLGDMVAQNLALLKNGAGFALGTDSGVIFFDGACRRVWETRTLARTLAINIAEEAGFVLAQDEAGVIRWLRVADGVKALSVFPSRNGKSWVAWTPEGFYDASPDGEELVGWHVNRDRLHSADFYPASRFRDLYYQPAEVSAALLPARLHAAHELDQKAARLADIRRQMQAGLPPQVTILSVREALDSAGAVAHLSYKLRMPSNEPVLRVRVLINGRPSGVVQEFPEAAARRATATAPDVAPTATRGGAGTESPPLRLSVPLPAGEVEIGLIAENRSAVSEMDRVRLTERLAAQSAKDEQIKPRLYALVVGVGAYAHASIGSLDFPAKDARDFAAELQRQRGRLYREVEVRLLEDGAATRESVIDGLDWLRRQVTANDLAVLFLAGHGVNDHTNRYYFVPANADPARLRSTGIANGDIAEALQALPSKVLAFLDTCHAGNVLGSGKQRSLAHADINRLINELTSAENGVIVFASSTGRETSQESDEWNNGVFTKALVEGLAGNADFNRDGAVSLNELNLYVADRVKQLTNGDQHANMIRPDSIRDFPFALMK